MFESIEYEITIKDYLAKLDKFTSASPVGRYFTWLSYFTICGLAWLSAILFYIKQGMYHNGSILVSVFALLLTFFLPFLYKWYQQKFWHSVFNSTAVQGIVGRKVLREPLKNSCQMIK